MENETLITAADIEAMFIRFHERMSNDEIKTITSEQALGIIENIDFSSNSKDIQ